jgi:hypothetical protein
MFMATKKWPAAYVYQVGDDAQRFHVLDFYSVAKTKRLFLKDPNKFLATVVKNMSYIPLYIKLAMEGEIEAKDKKVWKAIMDNVGGTGLIYLLLRKGDTFDPIFKLISEEESMNKAKLSEFLVGNHNLAVPSFNKLYGEMEFEEGGRLSKESHGPWELIFDNKASKDVDDVKGLLDVAKRFLSSKGFGALAYGDVMAANTLKGRRMAEYYPSGDSIRVRFGKASASRDHVRDFLHEIGHRNWSRKLSSNQKLAIHEKFGQQSRGRSDLNIGDTIEDSGGEVMEIVDRKYSPRGSSWIGKLIESPSDEKGIGLKYKIPDRFVGIEWIKKGDSGNSERKAYFPTAYATTNAEEFFSELFADWIMGNAQEPAKTWIDDLHS